MKNNSALSLLVIGIGADDHDLAFAFDDFALFAHFLDRRSDFHYYAILSLCLGLFSASAL